MEKCTYRSHQARAGMLSQTHRCAFGDDSADGYARGEGASTVALRRLDCDEEGYCGVLVASTAVNQDGRSNGLTVG